ncbi:MAG: hypothetical protein WCI73_10890, partial [Phycisphaerae bacterium]
MSLIPIPVIDVPLLSLDTTSSSNTTAAPAASAFPAAATPWVTPPILLKVSDAVVAGAPLTVNGGGINAGSVDVAIALYTTGASPAVPPAGALHPQIMQVDKDGQFVVCTMPTGATAGVYNVWVKNEFGWSSLVKMNVARALFMSDYQGYAGLSLEVTGRNFDQSEFGGTTATQLRLNNDSGGVYTQTITNLNPYNLTFTVGAAPLGTYYVEVSNDGGHNWSRPSSGQTLTLIAHTGTDPLGLGVSWAQDFKWTNIIDVTKAPYNINPADTSGNDTTILQNALNAAAAAGGGVVYLPNGNYYSSQIKIPPGVVLQGQDEYATKIYYIGAGGGGSFIYSYDDRYGYTSQPTMQVLGIAKLSILMPDPTTVTGRPDVYINFGDVTRSNPTNDQTLRLANRMFVASVNLTYDLATGNSSGTYAHRGIGVLFGGQQRFLMLNNHFVGWCATNPDSYLTSYCTLKGNYYEFSSGYVHDTANFAYYENNTVVIHPEYNQDTHGLFARANAYIANNSVTGAGDQSNVNNDGEGICNEPPGGNFYYGTATSATATSLTVGTGTGLTSPVSYYGTLSVLITYGTGRGQLRRVSAINLTTNTITVTQPFAIVPDSTSVFTLYDPLENFTVYNNTLNNCAQGIIPYGDQFDTVVAHNTTINSVGVFMWAARNSSGLADTADAFVRITGNTITGVSRRTNEAGIGIYTGRFDGANFLDTMTYSTEILYNSITGNNTLTPTAGWPPFVGIYLSSYRYSNMSNGVGTGDCANTLIAGNTLSNLKAGVMMTKGNYGQVITGNTYDSTVLEFINDNPYVDLYANHYITSTTNGLSDNTLVTSTNGFATGAANIAAQGAIIASVSSPAGTGNYNIDIVRDGVKPAVASSDLTTEYDTKLSTTGPAIQYYGYTFSSSRTFTQLVFQEGMHFSDGGWFANGSLKVQVRQNGVWVDAALTSSPAYPNGNTQATFGSSFQTYTFTLASIVGDGIRIYGTAGGSAQYVSIGELEVWATRGAGPLAGAEPLATNLAVATSAAQMSLATSAV